MATVILSLLLLITLLGTLEQVDHGLFKSQQKYFESIVVPGIDLACCLRAMHLPYEGAWTLPLPLPGGYLLMVLLAVNMICGGLIRLKKECLWFGKLLTFRFGELRPVPHRLGVFISHFSIVFMLLAGLVSLYYKRDGAVWVHEGSSAAEFQSFHESVIEIERVTPRTKDSKRKALVIPGWQFEDLSAGKARTFTSADLPFELMVMNHAENAGVRRAIASDAKNTVVDGFCLQLLGDRDPETKKPIEHEQMLNGAYVKVVDKKTKQEQSGIIWRRAEAPYTFKVGDEMFAVTIGRRTWPLPFTVRLDKFVRETHPGTAQARKFASHVTVFRDGREEKKLITMNEPLRYGGFAFFQSSFDAAAAERGGPQSSMFQVVSNPSDHWPLISLIAATVGLLIHMVWSLMRFMERSKRVATPLPSKP